jgi:hypothetical protein
MIISLDDYKIIDDTPSPIDNDEQIEAAIVVASDWIENLTGRTFEILSASPSPSPTSTIEILDGKNSIRLFTNNGPVTAIDKIEYWDGSDWFEYDTVSFPYTFKTGSNCIYFTLGHRFYKGYQNIRVTYSYGYETIPQDLAYACYLLTRHILNESERSGIRSQADGEQRFDYDHEIPAEINKIIIRYKTKW